MPRAGRVEGELDLARVTPLRGEACAGRAWETELEEELGVRCLEECRSGETSKKGGEFGTEPVRWWADQWRCPAVELQLTGPAVLAHSGAQSCPAEQQEREREREREERIEERERRADSGPITTWHPHHKTIQQNRPVANYEWC